MPSQSPNQQHQNTEGRSESTGAGKNPLVSSFLDPPREGTSVPLCRQSAPEIVTTHHSIFSCSAFKNCIGKQVDVNALYLPITVFSFRSLLFTHYDDLDKIEYGIFCSCSTVYQNASLVWWQQSTCSFNFSFTSYFGLWWTGLDLGVFRLFSQTG